MIVCICNNVNSEAVHAAIDKGASCIDSVRNETGAAACCGKCQFKVNRILQERQQMDTQEIAVAQAAYS
jgi:bacterioferritin-associated ferredoxin